MKISIENFLSWKRDDVTKQLLIALQEARDTADMQLGNPEIIMRADGQLALARLLGFVEGLDIVLNIRHDDIDTEDGENYAEE